ncbi:hypothetical protein EVAR_99724_1 [Eumeta japonica]|uniref:Uncharacterized protein n=1 Tax=Eumeta variegata TaxID=151549 RepID=A0A4C1SL94_EUMVA|nr:hypothetical protein EVAR_99724_1 [Eumeta japonica]
MGSEANHLFGPDKGPWRATLPASRARRECALSGLRASHARRAASRYPDTVDSDLRTARLYFEPDHRLYFTWRSSDLILSTAVRYCGLGCPDIDPFAPGRVQFLDIPVDA